MPLSEVRTRAQLIDPPEHAGLINDGYPLPGYVWLDLAETSVCLGTRSEIAWKSCSGT